MGWFGSAPEQKKKNYDESMGTVTVSYFLWWFSDDGAAGGGYDKYDTGSSAGMAPPPLGGGLGNASAMPSMSEDLGAASMPGNISQVKKIIKSLCLLDS